ncbi:CinA family protein [Candidatus Bipolaricaulota bacterium]|nr:CinA family protein [Candidatus Bipolaricaulota bacterium]
MNQEVLTDERLEVKTGRLLREDDLTLAIAESCTGGLIADRITDVPGSSDYFDRGVVSYSNRAKRELLDVKADSLENHGAVSEVVAAEMAKGVRTSSDTDIGLSSTGIAGPGGGTEEKPVGLVYLGLSIREGSYVRQENLDGTRRENKETAARMAMEFLVERLFS